MAEELLFGSREEGGLSVEGRACSLFENPELALQLHQEKHLIPCNGDDGLLVDRYDVRLLLVDRKELAEAEQRPATTPSESPELEHERYRDLPTEEAPEEAGPSQEESTERRVASTPETRGAEEAPSKVEMDVIKLVAWSVANSTGEEVEELRRRSRQAGSGLKFMESPHVHHGYFVDLLGQYRASPVAVKRPAPACDTRQNKWRRTESDFTELLEWLVKWDIEFPSVPLGMGEGEMEAVRRTLWLCKDLGKPAFDEHIDALASQYPVLAFVQGGGGTHMELHAYFKEMERAICEATAKEEKGLAQEAGAGGEDSHLQAERLRRARALLMAKQGAD